jgi:hypothetical protein
MRDQLKSVLVFTILVLAAATAAPSRSFAQPFIDFGRSFHVRLTNGTARSGADTIGTSRLHFSAFVVEGQGGSLTIEMTQGKTSLVSLGCKVRGYGRWNTICNSESFPSASLDASRPVEIRVTHVDDATDAQTVLYRASLPAVRFWSWSGMDSRGRPAHVEQRALRLDGSLGLATIRQGVRYVTGHPRDSEEFIDSFTFSFWDATSSNRQVPMTFRCRHDEGEWAAFRISGPSGAGDAQEVENRVRSKSGQVHEGEGETVYFQRKEFTATFPFRVSGTQEAPRDEPTEYDGQWTCELRNGQGAEKKVVRAFQFEVRNGEVVGHPATESLALPRGAVAIAVGFSPDAVPVSFDGAEIDRGFFGVPWGEGVSAPKLGELPKARAPRLTTPPGVSASSARKGR